jgi:hypothetical protein
VIKIIPCHRKQFVFWVVGYPLFSSWQRNWDLFVTDSEHIWRPQYIIKGYSSSFLHTKNMSELCAVCGQIVMSEGNPMQ